MGAAAARRGGAAALGRGAVQPRSVYKFIPSVILHTTYTKPRLNGGPRLGARAVGPLHGDLRGGEARGRGRGPATAMRSTVSAPPS